MLKIGEFSRLCQVTVKTLHHYDDIGLLKPSHIDPFTNYRYYTLDQLPRIHSIMALKELGLSLDQIDVLLREQVPPEQIRGMFRLKQAEIRQQLLQDQARLSQIEFRLRQLESEGSINTLDIVIKRVEPQPALTLRRIFNSRQERERVGQAIRAAIAQGRIEWTGSTPINIFYEEEFRGEYFDTEFAVPVQATHTASVSLGEVGTLKLRELPALEIAAIYMHSGDHPSLDEKFLLMQRWVVENGYQLSGIMRFLYHRGPMHTTHSSDYLTEIQHQVARA